MNMHGLFCSGSLFANVAFNMFIGLPSGSSVLGGSGLLDGEGEGIVVDIGTRPEYNGSERRR